MNKNTANHPINRTIIWLTLYIFFFNILSYSFLSYDNRPRPAAAATTATARSFASILKPIKKLFVSDAFADADEIIGEVSPVENAVVYEAKALSLGSGSSNSGADASGGSGGVNSLTGSYGYSYPIQLPEGRGGLTPSLSLSYSSMGPTTYMGPGWSLNIGSIERQTKNYVPEYTDDDIFVITLKGQNIELVQNEGEYRLKHEGLFLKIIKSGDSWIATDKSGARYFFGATQDSKVPGAGGTFKWGLNRIQDANGNYMTVAYWRDYRGGEIIYPERIEYAGHTNGEDPHYAVNFYYESRFDGQSSYIAGDHQLIRFRLSLISVDYQDDLIRAYELSYRNDLDGDLYTSFLDQIQMYGSDVRVYVPNYSAELQTFIAPQGWIFDGSAMEPVTFEYTTVQSPHPNRRKLETDTSQLWWDHNIWPLDFNGDGITDFFTIGKHDQRWWRLYEGNEGTFTQVCGGEFFHNFRVDKRSKVYTGDFNGDGMSDVLLQSTYYFKNTKLYLSNGEGFDDPINGPSLNQYDELYVGDFNGDGLSDAIVKVAVLKTTCDQLDNGRNTCTTATISAGAGWRMYISNGSGFDLVSENVENDSSTDSSGNYPFILGDYNGDGLTDVIIREGSIPSPSIDDSAIFFSTGTGLEKQYNSSAELGDEERISTGDFNGDGKTDLLVNDDGCDYRLYLSKGQKFVLAETGSFPRSNTLVMTGDFNGDGRTDILVKAYSSKWDGYAIWLSTGSGFIIDYYRSSWPGWSDRFIIADFNADGKSDFLVTDIYEQNNKWKGLKLYLSFNALNIYSRPTTYPRLLGKVTDAMGASQKITYVPSTVWDNNLLPFAIPTVRSITKNDNMPVDSHSTSSVYSYEGGYYDLETKEFRGFEAVNIKDGESGIRTYSVFHQDSRFQGRMESNTSWDSNGAMAVKTENSWAAKQYAADSGQDSRYFVYLKESTVSHYDTDESILSSVTTECGYDLYGNMNYEDKTVKNHQTGDVSTLFTRTEYNYDKDNWILDKPYSLRIDQTDPGLSDSNTQVLRETVYEYEDDRPWLLSTQSQIYWEDGVKKQIAVTYEYDIYGNNTVVTNPRNKAWTVTTSYDQSNGLFANWTYNALGHSVHNVFDPLFGAVTEQTNANGQKTTTTYDTFGRAQTITNPEGAVQSFSYNIEAGNHYTTVETSLQPTTTVYYDNQNRQIRSEVTGATTTIAIDTHYDDQGRVWKKSLPYFPGDTVYYKLSSFDARGRLETHTNADGAMKEFCYDGFDETITDENGHDKVITKDSHGRLVKVQEATGGITEYEYDIFGNLIWTKDPLGNQSHIYYNDLGRKISMDDPYMGHWEYEYDEAGNLESQKDGQGRIVEMTYDCLNRLETKTFMETGRQIEYVYDQSRSGYFNLGALTTMITTQPASFYTKTLYNYDKMGRIAHEQRRINGVDYHTYKTYDLAGRLDTITYPKNSAVFQYSYHLMGYLETVEKVESGASPTEMIRYSDINAMGQIGFVTYGNGVTTENTYYDGSQQLKTLQTIADTGDGVLTNIQNLEYVFDNVGNIETITDSVNNVNYNFGYDSINRLRTATADTEDSSRAYDQTYTYDLAGNMTAKTGKGAFKVASWEDSTKHIRPKSVIYQAGIEGNSGRQITYNQENKPTQITYNGTTTSLEYDGDGNRIKKSGNGSTTIYVGGLYEIRENEILINVFAGSSRIATIKNGQAFYTHSDHLGSTSLVTNANGVRVEEIGYLPFGATLFRNVYQNGYWDSVYRFTGQEYDAEYGLYNYNARLYDPVMCRFITADTIVPDWTNPQSLNRYAYVINNPLKYIDPSGHSFLAAIAIAALIGAMAGGVSAAMNGSDILQGVFIGAVTGAISGACLYAASTVTITAKGFSKLVAQMAIYSMAGCTAGATNAKITGGDVGQAALTSAVSAGLSNGLEGLIGTSSTARIGTNAVVGGVATEMNGGDFAEGALQAARVSTISVMMRNLYIKMVRYDVKWEPGGPAQKKRSTEYPIDGANNIGVQGFSPDPKSLWNEGGIVSRVANQIPGVNAIAGLHDVFQIEIDLALGNTARNVLNVPGMPIAAALTLTARMADSRATFIYYTNQAYINRQY
ncbi:MAG: hypothetical protein GY874_10975 [Desulfobacteraceae bacterium]|nr:hypothetical protein [Desulfobacteraceae bacterium]